MATAERAASSATPTRLTLRISLNVCDSIVVIYIVLVSWLFAVLSPIVVQFDHLSVGIDHVDRTGQVVNGIEVRLRYEFDSLRLESGDDLGEVLDAVSVVALALEVAHGIVVDTFVERYACDLPYLDLRHVRAIRRATRH